VYFRFLQFPLFGYVFTSAIFVYELIQYYLINLKIVLSLFLNLMSFLGEFGFLKYCRRLL
jgi:hypothetical protein